MGAVRSFEKGRSLSGWVALCCFAGWAGVAHAHPRLRFERNEGQTAATVRYLARGQGYTLFLAGPEAVVVLPAKPGEIGGPAVDFRLGLVGSDPLAAAEGLEPLSGATNYFVGDDPSQWQRAIAGYAQVRFREVYPGIDLLYYGREGQLEYDFVVAPGADPGRIRLSLAGADRIELDSSGALLLETGAVRVRWDEPYCYQSVGGVRREVDGSYRRLEDGTFDFRLGPYDESLPLVIDPVLVYATYLAPTSFAAGDGLQNAGLAIAADDEGYAYVAGITESASFPTTMGAFRTSRPGGRDVFVAKLDPMAAELEFATYLGGSATEVQNGQSLGVAVDAAGNIYLAGATNSANFPTTMGAYRTGLQGNHDGFVAKLGPGGDSLVYSTYLGGTGIDYAWDVAVDGQGAAYVCGETNGGFPTTAGAIQTASTSLSGFLSKLSPDGDALVYSTTLGTNTGKAKAVVVDKSGNAYVTGSADTPHGQTGYPVTEGAFQTMGRGSFDAFVSKVNPAGSAFVFSSYLGGSANEDGFGVGLDAAGNVYVAGNTNSTDFPVTEGAYQESFASTPTPVDDGYVIKLNPPGSSAIYSTYLGAAGGESMFALAVDGAGSAIVAGSTGSTDYPTTDDAVQTTYQPAAPGFSGIVSKLSPDGSDLAFSTYLHPTNDSVSIFYGLGLDGVGGAYVTGSSAALFPTTTGVFQTSTFNPAFGGPVVAKLAIAAATAKPLCGDFNGDGKIGAVDALAILRAVVGIGTCSLAVCDFTGDGKVNAADALAVLRVAVGQNLTPKCP